MKELIRGHNLEDLFFLLHLFFSISKIASSYASPTFADHRQCGSAITATLLSCVLASSEEFNYGP
jgi:hypothetical protein